MRNMPRSRATITSKHSKRSIPAATRFSKKLASSLAVLLGRVMLHSTMQGVFISRALLAANMLTGTVLSEKILHRNVSMRFTTPSFPTGGVLAVALLDSHTILHS